MAERTVQIGVEEFLGLLNREIPYPTFGASNVARLFERKAGPFWEMMKAVVFFSENLGMRVFAHTT